MKATEFAKQCRDVGIKLGSGPEPDVSVILVGKPTEAIREFNITRVSDICGGIVIECEER